VVASLTDHPSAAISLRCRDGRRKSPRVNAASLRDPRPRVALPARFDLSEVGSVLAALEADRGTSLLIRFRCRGGDRVRRWYSLRRVRDRTTGRHASG
jgi:hypothetical protein